MTNKHYYAVWKPIPGFSKYEMEECGSLFRHVRKRRTHLKIHTNQSGCEYVLLQDDNGVLRARSIEKLYYDTFG